MRKLFCMLIIVFVSVVRVHGKDLYVAESGNDSVTYADNSLDRAWRTINHGVNAMQAGDILYIRGGNYLENITISSGGSSQSGYKIIQNHPGEIPILDAKNGARGIDILNSVNYVKIIGLEIKNAAEWGIASWYAHSNSYITIQDCNIHDNGDGRGKNAKSAGGVAFHAESSTLANILIDNNEIHHNYRVGIALFADPGGVTREITISNNLIYRNPKNMLRESDVYSLYFEGIKGANVYNNYIYFSQKSPRIATNSNDNTFYNNVFAYNGWYGFDINARCTNNMIRNNIFAYNATGGINPKDYKSDNNRFYNNVFYKNGYVGILQLNDTTGTQIQNNIFQGGLGYSAVSWESGSLGTHDYNNYYDVAGYAAVGDRKYRFSDWIGSGKPEANSKNVNSGFVDVNYFNFSGNVPTLQNTGNNPSGECDTIGLCSNFVGHTKVFPFIPLRVQSANYDSPGASKTIDHTVDRLGSYSWRSNGPSGWIKYEVVNGPKLIRYIGLLGGFISAYYSPKDFHIAVSITGANDSDFTDVLDASYVDPSVDDWSAMAQWFELPYSVNARYIKLTIDNSQKDYSGATNTNVQVAEFYAIGPRETSESPKTISVPTGLKIVD